MPVSALYFDGQSSRRHAVEFDIIDGRAVVVSEFINRSEHLDAMQFSDALGRTPRLARFPDGASCEIADTDGLANLLSAAGVAPARVTHLTDTHKWVAASAVLLLAVLVAGYQFGVPAAAEAIANRLPDRALRTIGQQSLSTLDRALFSPSTIDTGRQQGIAAQFHALRLPPGIQPQTIRILFRKSDAMGANAVALPSGDIVVTDGLVKLARDDRELMGVLMHERGHVARRHGLRLLLENSIVQLFLAWYVGDVNTLAVTAPTALASAKYSRDFERAADADAIAMMHANGMDTGHLADLLERLEAERRVVGRLPGMTDPPPPSDNEPRSKGSLPMGYLSSHPATSERIQNLRKKVGS